jgi:anti-anti-sigma factor
MSPLARIVEEEQAGGATVTAIEGEVDASNARDVGERLRASATNQALALVVDLSRTSYLDSAGLNLLFELDLELRQRRQELHLVLPASSPLARTLAITGLDAAVPTHATRGLALQRIAAPG